MKKLATWLLSIGIMVTAIAAPPVRADDTAAPNANWSLEDLATDTLSDLEWTLGFDELIAPGQVTSGDISNAGTAPDCSFTVGRRTTFASGQTTFRVTVSGCAADGTIQPRLAANTVQDASTNPGPTADVTASDYATYDTTAPVLTLVSVDTLTETTADLNFTSDESGTYYYLVYAEADSAPDAATIKLQGTAVANGSAAATAATAVDVTMTGLTASTTYTVYLIVEDAAGNPSLVSDTDFTTPDTTAPVLTLVSVDTLTETTADLNFTSDESGTYYYLVYAEADSAPDAATIKLQGTAVANGSAAATAATAVDVTMTGLTASTTYTVYLIVEDAEGNPSLVSDTDFTTPDTTAPVLTLVSVDTLTETTADLNFTSDESGTYYYLVYAEADSAPDAATIKLQGTAVANGSAAATAATAVDVTMSGLTHSTNYTVYLIVEDAEGNPSLVSDTDFTTPDTTAPVLTLVSVDTLTETTADLNFTSDESGTYYYLVYAEADSAPDAATIKLQGTAVANGSAAATAATAVDVTMSGLTHSTNYTVYLIVEDAEGNPSLVSDTDFTTANDTTAPVLTLVSVDTLTETTADLNFTSDESGTYYYLVYAEADSAPDAATIKLQGTAVANGSAAATAATAVDVTMTGLTASTTYTVYLIVEDAAGNPSLVSDTDFTTATPDTSAPTAAWSAEATGDQSSLAGLEWTLTFNEAVTGLIGGDIENAATFTSTGCAFSVAPADAGAGLIYTVTVVSCSEGTIRPRLKASSVVDAASNSGPTADEDGGMTVTYDTTAPTASWSVESSGAQTSLAGLSWTLTFGEAVTSFSASSDIENATGFTSTGCTFSAAAVTPGLVYTITVAFCSDGTIRPSLKLNSVTDLATNAGPAAAVNGSTTVTYTAPSGGGGGGGGTPAPVSNLAPVVSGYTAPGASITSTNGTWDYANTYAYQWYRCTSASTVTRVTVPSSCTKITGATSASYVITALDSGSWLRVKVSATGSGGTTDILSASGAKVGPKPASVKAKPPRVLGTAAVRQVLTAKRGKWINDSTTYTYQWYSCTKAGVKNPRGIPAACTAITGASSKTYTVKAADKGSFLRVRVTATGVTGQGFRMSRTTGIIPN